MQTGSLVVVLPLPKFILPEEIKWLPVDDQETIYTVRQILKSSDGDDMAYLEEGCIGYLEGFEIGLAVAVLREVQGPQEVCIEELMEEEVLV